MASCKLAHVRCRTCLRVPANLPDLVAGPPADAVAMPTHQRHADAVLMKQAGYAYQMCKKGNGN